jgi:murein DD-endopeptidase MepM/ murein hydrolase activator NlpD
MGGARGILSWLGALAVMCCWGSALGQNSPSWLHKAQDVSAKAAHTAQSLTLAAFKRMQHYLAERDVLKTFKDAGEHSEAQVLDVLHKSGVGKKAPSSGSDHSGATNAGGAKSAGAASSAALPEHYRGNLRWPVDAGVVSSEFGERWGKMHKGIDIAADIGEPVYAIANGEVIYAGDGLRGYGNVVIIQHDTRTTSLYAHNSELKVKQGEHVTQGMLIALIGSTGHSTGPHTHFEIRDGDIALNPRTLLPPSKIAGIVGELGAASTLVADNSR